MVQFSYMFPKNISEMEVPTKTVSIHGLFDA